MKLIIEIKANRVFFLTMILLLCLGCIVFMWYLTPNGMGLVNDSVGYIGGARNILAGNGYSRLVGDGTTRYITNYPPLLSIVIASISFFGIGEIEAVWYLNILLFALNTMMIATIVRVITKHNVIALMAAAMFAVSEPIFVTHSYAMSEPLYIFLFLLSLYTLARYFAYGHKGSLILSGFIAGLSVLARYVGISIFGVGLLALILFKPELEDNRDSAYIKIRSIFQYVFSFLIFPVVWLSRNAIVSTSVANRQFVYHAIPMDKIHEGILNFWGWLLPETSGFIEKRWQFWGVVFILLVVIVFVIVLRTIKNYYKNPSVSSNMILGWLFAVLGLVYLAVLYLSLTFVDASPILEHRILAPFYVCILVLLSILIHKFWSSKKRFQKIILGLVIPFLFISFAEDSIDTIPLLHMDGQGFASSAWQESELINEAKDLPQGTLFSNKITAIYILSNRPAFIIPSPMNPATQQPRENYDEDIQSIKDLVNSGDAYVLVFNYFDLLNDPNEKQWMMDLSEGMPEPVEYDDGVIFGIDQ